MALDLTPGITADVRAARRAQTAAWRRPPAGRTAAALDSAASPTWPASPASPSRTHAPRPPAAAPSAAPSPGARGLTTASPQLTPAALPLPLCRALSLRPFPRRPWLMIAPLLCGPSLPPWCVTFPWPRCKTFVRVPDGNCYTFTTDFRGMDTPLSTGDQGLAGWVSGFCSASPKGELVSRRQGGPLGRRLAQKVSVRQAAGGVPWGGASPKR